MRQSATHIPRPAFRRRALRLVPLLLLLFTLALAGTTGASARVSASGGWHKQTSGTGVALMGVAFLDASHGWAVGEGGTILATVDGGVTWAAQISGTTKGLRAVAFTDATHGWVVGYDVILLTKDGGATWNTQRTWSGGNSEYFFGVSFADDTHGWAVGGGGHIFATTDGGVTWTPQDSGSSVHLSGVAFADATHGWAVGNDGTILVTKNGGALWSTQRSGPNTDYVNSVAFSDATHGWAVGWDEDAGAGTILATTDGGATWRAQSSGVSTYLGAVAFGDSMHGCAVGNGGVILTTTTGGLSPAPVVPSLAKLKPASGKRGVTVTITGAGFGAKRAKSSVKFGSKACTKYVSWSDTRITCKVPKKAKLGIVKVSVTTTGGRSGTRNFRVKR